MCSGGPPGEAGPGGRMRPSGCGESFSPTPRIMASMSSPSGSVGGRGLRVDGKESEKTLNAANNYAVSLNRLRLYKEAKALMRKWIPVARRAFEANEVTLSTMSLYATIIASDPSATLTDLREAVTTFEETVRTARRVFGVAHPDTTKYEGALRCTREELSARETPPQNAVDASS